MISLTLFRIIILLILLIVFFVLYKIFEKFNVNEDISSALTMIVVTLIVFGAIYIETLPHETSMKISVQNIICLDGEYYKTVEYRGGIQHIVYVLNEKELATPKIYRNNIAKIKYDDKNYIETIVTRKKNAFVYSDSTEVIIHLPLFLEKEKIKNSGNLKLLIESL